MEAHQMTERKNRSNQYEGFDELWADSQRVELMCGWQSVKETFFFVSWHPEDYFLEVVGMKGKAYTYPKKNIISV